MAATTATETVVKSGRYDPPSARWRSVPFYDIYTLLELHHVEHIICSALLHAEAVDGRWMIALLLTTAVMHTATLHHDTCDRCCTETDRQRKRKR